MRITPLISWSCSYNKCWVLQTFSICPMHCVWSFHCLLCLNNFVIGHFYLQVIDADPVAHIPSRLPGAVARLWQSESLAILLLNMPLSLSLPFPFSITQPHPLNLFLFLLKIDISAGEVIVLTKKPAYVSPTEYPRSQIVSSCPL